MSDKKLDLAALRLRAVAKQPYLASALWSITMVESPIGNGTMGVGKNWVCYIDPNIFDVWDMDEAVGVLIHEVWHLLRDHHSRAEKLGVKGIGMLDKEMREKKYHWNIAADLGINDDLRREVKLPETGHYPEKYQFPNNQIAEKYYTLIRAMPPEDRPQLQDVRFKIVDGDGDEDKELAGPLSGNDGSGAGGNDIENEEGEGDGDGEGEGKQGQGRSRGLNEAEQELIRRKVANDIKEGKYAGTAPGHAERWADNQLNPIVDWRTKLQGAIRANIAQVSGMVDYTYTRPSRRQSVFPRIVLPSLRGPKPDVGIGIDTSGSMSKGDLDRALTEVKGILDAIHAEVKVYAGDTQVYKSQQVYQAEEIELTGGGGTDMGAVLTTMNEDKPHIAVIITDGYTPWLEVRPKDIGKIIVCLTRSDTQEVPDWVDEVIEVKGDEEHDTW